jgi:hypothetical protein
MNTNKIINLEEFRRIVEALANETKHQFPGLYFDHAGMIPIEDVSFKYDSSPTNSEVFATTGGDGVHYSILALNEQVQPVIMTVPMNFGNSMKAYNWIIGENLNEFLSIGFYNGWFPIEELCYNNEWAINFYSKENMEDHYQKNADIQFVKKLRNKFGYNHIPLNNQRLKELEYRYFEHLQFNADFIEKHIERRS